MRWRLVPIVLVIALVAAACSGGEQETGSTASTVDGGPTRSASARSGGAGGSPGASASGVRALAVSLQQFDRCDTLLGWIHTEAAERVGPYGFNGDVYFAADAAFAMEGTELAAGDDAAPVPATPGAGAFSTTNVQEIGVDEPDIVKTDGERLFILSGDTLSVIDAAPTSPQVLDRLRFRNEYPTELLLGEDELLVISSVWGPFDEPGAASDVAPWAEGSTVAITEVAVGPDGDLTETGRLEISGSYVTARRIGDGVRLVVRDVPDTRLPFVYPSSSAAEEDATGRNREIVADSELEDWLPRYRLTTPDGEERSGVLVDCDRVTAPEEFSGMSTVSVLTFTMGEPLTTGNPITLFGAADTVYASSESLYAATYVFPDVIPFAEPEVRDEDPDFLTQIHRFDITDPAGASHVASGEVRGHLLNQFAMSEHDGHLRVATTEGSPWFCCDDEISSSSVVVLGTEGDALVEVGRVADLGVGESIFGVRFVGDRGYVVTFRMTDPLYVVDLSDPGAPRVEGELKITGYSSYLHPVTESLLLGVGQEATEDGMTTGTKVSLFDVSDPADPREVDRWVFDNAGSAAEWDHRAFLYWAPEDLAVVPISTWRGDARFGAVAFGVADGSLEELGRITQSSAGVTEINPACEVIQPEDPPRDSELFWIVEDGASIVHCPDDETPARGGFYCEPMESWGLDVDELGDLIDVSGGTVDICWPDYDEGREITRSVVIDDTLWTIGHRVVQANDLATLEPLSSVDL